MRFVTAALIAAALAVPAAADAKRLRGDARLDQLLAGRVAGKPVDCLRMPDIRSSEIIDGKAIVYRTGGNRLYVNYPDGAYTLDDDDVLVTRTSISQLCNLDIVNLYSRQPWFQNGTVGLNKFVPYTLPKDAPRGNGG